MSDPKHLHARVSDAEHAAVTAFARAHGVTAASLGVALCRWLQDDYAGGHLNDAQRRCVKALVEEARRVDDERRARKPPPE